MKYAHTNIVAEDWQRLVKFYCDVFECVPVPPERQQSGDWLSKGTGVTDAQISGMHLRLPGHGDAGPTLEIYQYKTIESNLGPRPNRKGLGHLAFVVDNVEQVQQQVLANGGSAIGAISQTHVDGVGQLTFVYLTDPEGNIIEIQNWQTNN